MTWEQYKPTLTKTIVRKLQAELYERGISIAKLAEMTETSKATLYNVFNGNVYTFSVELLYKICVALNLSMDYICGRSMEKDLSGVNPEI